MMCACGTDRHPRGAALVIVMLVMAVLLLAGTTFMTISSTESQIALNERVSGQAVHLAEAAIQKAIAQLDQDPAYTGETNTSIPCPFPPCGTFTVRVTPASEQLCPATSVAKDIVATATVPVGGGQAVVQLGATADRIAYPFRWGAFATQEYAYYISLSSVQALSDSYDSTRGAYNVSNSAHGGDVGANGSLYLWNMQVKGGARAGSIALQISSTAEPAPVPNVPAESFPDVVPPPLPSPLPVSVAPPAGDYTFQPGAYHYDTMSSPPNTLLTTSTTSQDPVTIYVTGALTLGDSVTFTTNGSPLTIYVTGTLSIGNNVTFTPSGGPLTIIATGNITWGNNVAINSDAPVTIYATGQSVIFGNNATLGRPNLVAGSPPATNLSLFLKSDGGDADMATFITGSGFRLFGSLYGRNARVILGDSANFYGSVIGRRIIRGTTTSPFELQGMWWLYPPAIHFDQAMYDNEVCLNTSNGRFAVRRGTWREAMP